MTLQLPPTNWNVRKSGKARTNLQSHYPRVHVVISLIFGACVILFSSAANSFNLDEHEMKINCHFLESLAFMAFPKRVF